MYQNAGYLKDKYSVASGGGIFEDILTYITPRLSDGPTISNTAERSARTLRATGISAHSSSRCPHQRPYRLLRPRCY
eukprot:2386873-Pyramimonas_sp.AAC.1